MAFVLEDRVIETANNPGQGDFELLGAMENSRSFVSAIGNGNTTRYLAIGAEGAEIGLAQVSAGSPDRLQRPGTVKNMDGTTAPVNFSGTVTVACIASVEDVYHSGNLMEIGANANGEYVRIASGLLICQRAVTLDLSTSGFSANTFATPAAFVGNYWGGFAFTAVPSDGALLDAMAAVLLSTTVSSWRLSARFPYSGTVNANLVMIGV